jgi:hypothetical protein
VPREGREEWFARWNSDLTAWQILRDRGELTHSGYFDFLCFAVASLKDAWRVSATQAVLHGPAFVLGVGAVLLILIAAGTHGFRGARSFFAAAPIQDPPTLVSVDYPSRASERAAALARLIPMWREKSSRALDIAGYRYAYASPRAWVSWNLFSLLGARPVIGRLLEAGDRDAVLISYPMWRSICGANPRIVGTRIQVSGERYTIVGVLPQLFWALSPGIDVWIPLDLRVPASGPGFRVAAVARLRPGATEGDLAKELSELANANLGPPRQVRVSTFATRLPGRGTDFYVIGTVFALISCLVLVGREPLRPSTPNWRYWPFLCLKILLAISIPLIVWMELDSAVRTFRPALGLSTVFAWMLTALMFLVSCVRALQWSCADQRRRCPVCLQRLTMPVSVGSPGSIFEPVLTELVCPNGHGALSLPDDEVDQLDRWTVLDGSWSELFKKKSALP